MRCSSLLHVHILSGGFTSSEPRENAGFLSYDWVRAAHLPLRGEGFWSGWLQRNPRASGSRHGEGLWLIQPWLVMRLVLFSLAAGDDDRGSAEDEHDASDVEDRSTDAAGGEIR